jgi:chemotaxis protein methyltransferase WspC
MDKITEKIALLIEKNVGISIDSIGEASFQRAITQKMHELNIKDRDLYYARVSSSEVDFQNLMEELVVPESYFFRDPTTYDFLETYIANDLLPLNKKGQTIRVLSIPCSTGEEPYSLAIKFLSMGFLKKQFHIDAVDISQQSLKKAVEGIYSPYSFRFDSAKKYQDQYFEHKKSLFHIKNFVKECVSFHLGNALDFIKLFENQQFDIIICKNLFIYMQVSAQDMLIKNLTHLLSKHGILIVSPIEIEYIKKAGFQSHPDAKSFVFQKATKDKSTKPVLKEIVKLKKVKELNPQKKDGLLLAKQYADEGKFEEARKLCAELLIEKGPDDTAYFILGLIAHALDQDEEAEDYLLKTIYLNPSHHEALIHLALLFEKKGEHAYSKLFFNRAKRAVR